MKCVRCGVTLDMDSAILLDDSVNDDNDNNNNSSDNLDMNDNTQNVVCKNCFRDLKE